MIIDESVIIDESMIIDKSMIADESMIFDEWITSFINSWRKRVVVKCVK